MTHEALLRALTPGAVMWIPAAGNSLWPLLFDGDSLRVERVSQGALRRGELAVIKRPDGILAAHLVVSADPLITESTAGVRDPLPLEALGRVTAFRREGRVIPIPESLALALRWWPLAARVAKRVPLVPTLVRALRSR
ncbi:MAG: hypothetical protein JNM17_29575 [Archangium sp.]|nr:hypothetical protein [Archangium sp.]